MTSETVIVELGLAARIRPAAPEERVLRTRPVSRLPAQRPPESRPTVPLLNPQAAYISLLDTSTSSTNDAGGSAPKRSDFQAHPSESPPGVAPIAQFL